MQIEKEEENVAQQDPEKQCFHLCIVNLVIGTLYCAKVRKCHSAGLIRYSRYVSGSKRQRCLVQDSYPQMFTKIKTKNDQKKNQCVSDKTANGLITVVRVDNSMPRRPVLGFHRPPYDVYPTSCETFASYLRPVHACGIFKASMKKEHKRSTIFSQHSF